MAKNPFEYLNAINAGEDIITHADDPALKEDGYNPFLTNRSMSYHIDAVLHANELNMRPDLDKKLQYLYLLYNLRPRKRIAKWHKPDTTDDIALIQQVAPVTKHRAASALRVLSKEQLKQIQDSVSDNNNDPIRRAPASRSKANR